MGYISRDHGSVAVHDDLVATALVLFDGDTRVAIVTCDLLTFHLSTVASIRTRVYAETGIPERSVMLCGSHTHSGPIVYADDTWPKRREYLDDLANLIVGAVVRANDSLQRAAWGIGRGKAEIGANRRQHLANGHVVIGENAAGPIDRDLLVLRVDTIGKAGQATEPLAVLINYACHAVCLSGNSYVISADWPGVMRRTVESATGATAGFLQGACADINPLNGPQDTFDSAQRLGRAVAERVLDLYDDIPLQGEANLGVARQIVGLPLLGPVGRDGECVPPFVDLASQITSVSPSKVVAFLDRRFPWAASIKERDGVWYASAELQALALDDVVLVSLAAEPFVEIGLQIKARSVAAITFVAAYANGCVGYVPMPLAYDLGGYEVDASYVYYRLYAALAPACAELMIGGALTLIDNLFPIP